MKKKGNTGKSSQVGGFVIGGDLTLPLVPAVLKPNFYLRHQIENMLLIAIKKLQYFLEMNTIKNQLLIFFWTAKILIDEVKSVA